MSKNTTENTSKGTATRKGKSAQKINVAAIVAIIEALKLTHFFGASGTLNLPSGKQVEAFVIDSKAKKAASEKGALSPLWHALKPLRNKARSILNAGGDSASGGEKTDQRMRAKGKTISARHVLTDNQLKDKRNAPIVEWLDAVGKWFKEAVQFFWTHPQALLVKVAVTIDGLTVTETQVRAGHMVYVNAILKRRGFRLADIKDDAEKIELISQFVAMSQADRDAEEAEAKETAKAEAKARRDAKKAEESKGGTVREVTAEEMAKGKAKADKAKAA